MPHIVHMTSAHPRYDSRIFIKQCRTMASHGHEVTLVAADGHGDELRDGVGNEPRRNLQYGARQIP